MSTRRSLVALVLLNVALASIVAWQGYLLHIAKRENGMVRPLGATREISSELARLPVTSPAEVAEPATPSPPARPPVRVVDWRQVESADYRTYVNNLRSIGCPEQTIRDIVTADMVQAYTARRREVLAALIPTNYWKTTDRAALLRERRTADEQLGGFLVQLLGPGTVASTTGYEWKLAEMDLRLSFLGDDRRETTRDVLLRFAEVDEQIKSLCDGRPPSRDPEELRRLLNEYNRKRAELGQLLSQDEYERVEMSASWTGENLRRAMEKFQPTEEEFRLIFREWRGHDERLVESYANGGPDPGNSGVFQRIQQQLTPERYEEYRRHWWR